MRVQAPALAKAASSEGAGAGRLQMTAAGEQGRVGGRTAQVGEGRKGSASTLLPRLASRLTVPPVHQRTRSIRGGQRGTRE